MSNIGNSASSIVSPPIASRIAVPMPQPAIAAITAAQNAVPTLAPPAVPTPAPATEMSDFAFVTNAVSVPAKVLSRFAPLTTSSIAAIASDKSSITSTSFSVMLSPRVFIPEPKSFISPTVVLPAHFATGFKNLSQSRSLMTGSAVSHAEFTPSIASASESRNAGTRLSIVHDASGCKTFSVNHSSPSPIVSAKGARLCSRWSNASNAGSRSSLPAHSVQLWKMFSPCSVNTPNSDFASESMSEPYFPHELFSGSNTVPSVFFTLSNSLISLFSVSVRTASAVAPASLIEPLTPEISGVSTEELLLSSSPSLFISSNAARLPSFASCAASAASAISE